MEVSLILVATAVTAFLWKPCFCVDIRLNGSSTWAGRVEVFSQGEWGILCNSGFGVEEARVVCRMLGITEDQHSSKPWVANFGQGNGSVLLDDVDCRGDESNLTNCRHLPIGVHRCLSGEHAGVDCKPPRSLQIRLSDGSRNTKGRVEIYYGGQWGTICDYGFGVQEASVVCREMGFERQRNMVVRRAAFYGEGAGPVWMHDLSCAGTEQSLTSCSFTNLGFGACTHKADVGVDCSSPHGPTHVSITETVLSPTDGGCRPLQLMCTAYNFSTAVVFEWSGVRCSPIYANRTVGTCTFTPLVESVVTCTAWNTTVMVSSSYTASPKCPPSVVHNHTTGSGSPENPAIISIRGQSVVSNITISLVAHPAPTVQRVEFIGRPNFTQTTDMEENFMTALEVHTEVNQNIFRIECENQNTTYVKQCTMICEPVAIPEYGLYNVTIGNEFGDMAFVLEVVHEAADDIPRTDRDSSDKSQALRFYYILGGSVGGGVLLAVIAFLVSLAKIRKKPPSNDNAYDRSQSALQSQASEFGYSDLARADGTRPSLSPEDSTYDNHAVEKFLNEDSHYVNVAFSRERPAAYENVGLDQCRQREYENVTVR